MNLCSFSSEDFTFSTVGSGSTEGTSIAHAQQFILEHQSNIYIRPLLNKVSTYPRYNSASVSFAPSITPCAWLEPSFTLSKQAATVVAELLREDRYHARCRSDGRCLRSPVCTAEPTGLRMGNVGIRLLKPRR